MKKRIEVILFSPAKINLGLHVLRKRSDGFHDISTVMYPLPFRDIIEIKPGAKGDKEFTLTQSGIPVPAVEQDHLCFRAWQLFCTEHRTIPARVHLHKRIPPGAGLGGGSSNASTVLKGLNAISDSPFSNDQLKEMAAMLGSDCAIFVENQPALAEGRGEILTETSISLSDYWLVLLYPEIHVDTASAYSQVIPDERRPSIMDVLKTPIEEWKSRLTNDFEVSVFGQYPEIAHLKSQLYKAGAIYASMSGSGSSVYGLFRQKQPDIRLFSDKLLWQGSL